MSHIVFRVVLTACLVGLTGCDDTRSTCYFTAVAAHADGAVQRGWLPAALPDSASNIKESHNLDTNAGEGSFSVGAADMESFLARLLPMIPSQINRLSPDYAKLGDAGYTFYSIPGFTIAANRRTGEVRFKLKPEPN